MSAGHPLSGKQHLQPEDFCGETFILPDDSDSPGRTEELQNILAKAGIRCGRILYVPNQESILLNIRSGKGMALLDNSLREAYDERYCFSPVPGNCPAVCGVRLETRQPEPGGGVIYHDAERT